MVQGKFSIWRADRLARKPGKTRSRNSQSKLRKSPSLETHSEKEAYFLTEIAYELKNERLTGAMRKKLKERAYLMVGGNSGLRITEYQ